VGASKCATRSGSEIMLPHAAVDALRSRVPGGVLGRDDDGYDRARNRIFNRRSRMLSRVAALDVEDDVLEPDAALRPEPRDCRVVPVEVLHWLEDIHAVPIRHTLASTGVCPGVCPNEPEGSVFARYAS
jgi:hypothetical protein